MIEVLSSVPPDTLYEAAAFVGTAALSLMAGRAWGRRAVATVAAARTALDTVCDAIEDGTLSADEAEQIALAVQAVRAAATK